ncbi:MAG: bifunctional DNA primase/polymerase [Methylophilaceae bacterium]
MNHKEQIFEAAKAYISRGWHVFPLHSIIDGKCTCGNADCSDAGKHPAVSRGVKEATTDTNKIEAWFSTDEQRNIGIATGESSDLTIIDIDIGNKGGAETWIELIQEHGEPDTLVVETPSGGSHFYFKFNSSLKTSSNTLGKGIDVRNEKGYVVAPPSLHRSGSHYKWLNEGTPLANLPAHLCVRKETRGRPKKDDYRKRKFTLEQVEEMLSYVPASNRDTWRNYGVILGREFNRSDEGWQVYLDWANKEGGKKGRNHDQIMHEAFYELSQQTAHKELTIASIVQEAISNGFVFKSGDIEASKFVYVGQSNNFLYIPTRTYFSSESVDSGCSPINEDGKIIKASQWIKKKFYVTSLACDPKLEDGFSKGFECIDGEIIEDPNAAIFNLYRKPILELGNPKLAKPFIDHIHRVFPNSGDAEQFLNYIAHRVQKPFEKPRFALLIAGTQGTGKDSCIEFCLPAIGHWNCSNIDPSALQSSFNEYAASTLVRISEAANLHDMNRFAFNEQTKVLIAGNPDQITINQKYGSKYSVRMYCGMVITTNHLSSGIYIPPDDRRYDVIESASLAEMGLADPAKRRQYFEDLWHQFNQENGANHMAAFLHERNISGFSASNGQRQTRAQKAVIEIGRERHAWLRDILAELDYPRFVSGSHIKELARKNDDEINGAFNSRLNAAIADSDYFKYANPAKADGRWTKPPSKKGLTIYAKIGTPAGLDPRDEVTGEMF